MLHRATVLITIAALGAAGCAAGPLDRSEPGQAHDPAALSAWLASVADARGSAGPPDIRQLDLEAGADAIGHDSSLAECIHHALQHNPRLTAAFHRWRAALEVVPQVTALPDPRVSYGYFVREVETRVGPQRHRVALAQTFPFFGKLELRGDVAASAADAELERLLAAALEVVEEVRAAYAELAWLRGAITLTEENLLLLQQLEQIARRRYAVAVGSHPDLLRLQIELGQLEDRLAGLRQQRDPLSARLNALLDRPVDAEAPWPDEVPGAGADAAIDETALAERLLRHSPRLAALDRQIGQHRAATELARREGLPDFTLSVEQVFVGEAVNRALADSGQDATIVGISINVPMWRDRYDAAVREAIRRRLAVAADRTHLERQLVAELEQALFELRDARRRVSLYERTLLPKANESLESLLSGYQSGGADFLDLIDAERVLLEFQLAGLRAGADAAIAAAAIERLVGGPITTATAEEGAAP